MYTVHPGEKTCHVSFTLIGWSHPSSHQFGGNNLSELLSSSFSSLWPEGLSHFGGLWLLLGPHPWPFIMRPTHVAPVRGTRVSQSPGPGGPPGSTGTSGSPVSSGGARDSICCCLLPGPREARSRDLSTVLLALSSLPGLWYPLNQTWCPRPLWVSLDGAQHHAGSGSFLSLLCGWECPGLPPPSLLAPRSGPLSRLRSCEVEIPLSELGENHGAS